jgi:hypothetical protein
MTAIFEQTFLKPGRYCVGRDEQGNKKFRDLTADDLREYVEGTKGVINAGYAPPVLLEHAPKGSPEGAPVNRRDEKAAEVRNGVGFLQEAFIGGDGAALHKLEISDPQIAEKLKNKSIKFTSPELRDAPWTDGNGVTHTKFVSHIALTHKPRAVDQSPIEPVDAMQFSLDDWEPIQMATDEEESKAPDTEVETPETPAEPENPDAPKETGDDQQFQALLEHLKEFGIDLVSDTTEETFKRDLLIACKTAKAARELAEADKAKDDAEEEDDDSPAFEDKGQNNTMQFSIGDAEEGKIENKLLARVIKQEYGSLVAKLNGMVTDGKLTPAGRDQLLALDGATQFSADGDFLPRLTLPQVVQILDETVLPGTIIDTTQLSVEDHPGGKAFIEGDAAATAEVVKKTNDAVAEALPGMYTTK